MNKPTPTRANVVVLKQMLNLIPLGMINRIARETGVEDKSRSFTPTSHLAAMLFAQLSRAMGLNDVCDWLRQGWKEGGMIATVTEPPFATGLTPWAQTLPRHISPTAAKAYLGCSLRFWFARIACIRKKTPAALHLGKAVHAALQAFHLARWRGADDSPETIAAAYDKAFSDLERDEGPVNFKDDDHRDEVRLDGLRVVAAYLDSPEAMKEKPRAVEVLLHEEIPGLSVPLTGAMDLVENNFTPVDFKSAAARPDPDNAAFDHELQLVSYQLLMEAATGETPPSLDLVFLVKTKTPQVIRVCSPPADTHRKRRVTALLETAVEGIATGRHHPQPGMHCSWCLYLPSARRGCRG